ncbi:MAG: RNA polymerase sigma factor [bacterium]
MPNEREILYRLKDGNVAAFEEILSAYERRIYSFLVRMTGNREEAKDLTQDTFLKLYRNHPKIDPESNFQSWLFMIAANTARDWFRRHKEPLIYLDDLPEGALPETKEGEGPYYKAEQAERVRLVDKALSKIKPAYRHIILLFYHEDLSYEEIAATLKLPTGTVKTNLHRAKKELVKLLSQAYEQDY